MFRVPQKQTEGTVEMHEIFGRYIHVTNHHGVRQRIGTAELSAPQVLFTL